MASRPARAASSRKAPPRGRGRPARTVEERSAQRARLLAATMAAIREDGPDLSIDELAAAAGVSKPVLYAEFGDKLGLADAVAVELVQAVSRDLVGSVTRGEVTDVDHGVRLAVTMVIDLIVDEPELYRFVVRSMRANDRGLLDNPLVREIHERARTLVHLVAPHLDAPTLNVLVDGLFGFVFGAVESWQISRRPSKARLIDGLSAIIVTGIRTADRF